MRSILEKALIALLNEEKGKADALFHDFILERSRQIHESLRQGEDFVLDESWQQELAIDEMFTESDLDDDEMMDNEIMDDDMMEGSEVEDEVTAEVTDAVDTSEVDAVPAVDTPQSDAEMLAAPMVGQVDYLASELHRLAAEFDVAISKEQKESPMSQPVVTESKVTATKRGEKVSSKSRKVNESMGTDLCHEGSDMAVDGSKASCDYAYNQGKESAIAGMDDHSPYPEMDAEPEFSAWHDGYVDHKDELNESIDRKLLHSGSNVEIDGSRNSCDMAYQIGKESALDGMDYSNPYEYMDAELEFSSWNDGYTEQKDELNESFTSDLPTVDVKHSEGDTTGNYKYTVDKQSRALSTPIDKRMGGKPVEVKSSQYAGYEREESPKSVAGTTRRNTVVKSTVGRREVRAADGKAALLNQGGDDKMSQRSIFDKTSK